jgi:hypothetical protein
MRQARVYLACTCSSSHCLIRADNVLHTHGQSLHVRILLVTRQSLKKKKLMLMMRFLRPISSLAPLLPRRCSTTSTECAMDDRTLRDPSAPSRAGASSSLCSVPSRSPSFGSRLVTGPCHALLIRTTVRAKLSTSRTWQHGRTFQRAAGRDSSLMQKCVILSRRSTPWVA